MIKEFYVLHYDIEADWMLLNTCNYRCDYCFFPDSLLGEKLRVTATPAQWQAALAATQMTWLLHMTGGEPSIYPDFADLCVRLTERHLLSINSNLTNPSFAEFSKCVDPQRVSFINAGLHSDERARKAGEASFLRHAALLQNSGFRLMISMVATPEVLRDAERIVQSLRPYGLVPFPKVLRGAYRGRCYPTDYTYFERRAFRDLAIAARQANKDLIERMSENPTIDLMHDDDFLKALPAFTGQSCEAGRLFVRMEGNGDLFRCSTKEALGNVLNGSFALHRRAAPCDTNYCFYFCKKYTAMGFEEANA